MDMASRKQHLQTLLERYLKARKLQKGAVLDEYCRNTRQNRKYVITRPRFFDGTSAVLV